MQGFILRATIVFIYILSISFARGSRNDVHHSSKTGCTSPELTIWNIPNTRDLPGTFGSGLAYDPFDENYWMITDSASQYLRLVRVETHPIHGTTEILEVIPITENGIPLTAFDLDPEDLVVSPIDGTLWACEESYPFIFHMHRNGTVIERVATPAKYTDRVPNQGLEGITISPDGKTLYAMLQSGLASTPDKRNTLLLAYHIPSKTFKEYDYRLDGIENAISPYPVGVVPKFGANCLAAIDRRTLLVCERDNQPGYNSRIKRIYRVTLPETPVTFLTKKLFLDIKELGYPFEKLEGLALVDDEKIEIAISNDNDGDLVIPSEIWSIELRGRKTFHSRPFSHPKPNICQ